ncbi:hypothetical protein E2605_18670 [Dysgonomonas capnocytophagoides]|uniref:Uncharacterized protein n=1 Tax=Dysgonomonas capnocytophagoides TaxID=45254 RepID=A0A4Y8KUX5_9BACT|nr:hypothetical protein [Dysgonomonas capnocytophagoides]TFD92584.1 hypothetical protein E2605_18670 [Dysgonomonas capnocytophagoides]
MVPLTTGIKFKALWEGHEDRVYQIKSVYKDYSIHPEIIENTEDKKPRVHIKADLVDCPHEKRFSSGFWFTVYEDTLTDVNNPDHKIELIEVKEVQLTLF